MTEHPAACPTSAPNEAFISQAGFVFVSIKPTNIRPAPTPAMTASATNLLDQLVEELLTATTMATELTMKKTMSRRRKSE